MDSPEINNLLMTSCHQLPSIKDVLVPDDSGYLTVTPSSAESTGYESGLISLKEPRLFSSRYGESHQKNTSFISYTPEESSPLKRPRSQLSKPKFLQEYMNEPFTSICSLGESIECIHENSLSPLHEVMHMDTNLSCSNIKRKLRRQNALSENIDWNPFNSPAQSTYSIHSSNFQHEGLQSKIRRLAVTDRTSTEMKWECNPTREKLSPISMHNSRHSLSFLPYNSLGFHSEPNNIKKVGGRHVKVCPETVTSKTQSLSYPVTPVKHRKRIERFSPEMTCDENSSESPEKIEDRSSPIFKMGIFNVDRKSAERPNFGTQKIGTPEKNQILYPNLRPVTPPKKIKTPEKKRKSNLKTQSSKLRRKLYLGYCGRENIDFLKKLRERYHTPLKCLLSKLSCEDLENVCKVSHTWTAACLEDPETEKRMKKSAQHKERIKENIESKKIGNTKPVEKNQQSVTRVRRDLMDIQNYANILPTKVQATPRSPPVSPGKRRARMYMKVASEESTRQVRACPRCTRPARVRGQWGECSGRTCSFRFCVRCLAQHLPGLRGTQASCCLRPLEAPSPSKQPPPVYIGSKQSHKNLRRL